MHDEQEIIFVRRNVGTSGVVSLAGTAGQIVASASTGAVTLSLASAITGIDSITATAALTLSGGSSGASLVLGSGASGIAVLSPKGTSFTVSVSGAQIAAYDDRVAAIGGGGELLLQHRNTAGSKTSYASLNAYAIDGSAAAETGALAFSTITSGTRAERMRLTGNLLIGTTTDMSGVTGGVKIASTSASTSSTTGALQVAGGIYAGAASVFGGAVSANGLLTVTGSGTETSVATAKVGVSALGGIPRVNLINPTNSVNGKYADIINTSGGANGAISLRFIDDGVASATTVFSVAGRQGATDSFITAPGTGAHVFGTTNTVTLSAGALTATGTVTGASLATTQTPSASVATASTHKVAIVLNGATYYILLTNVP